MKKTKFMRAALLLLVLTLITSCFVGGTFAKYTTSTTGSDSARVAYWGFDQGASTTIDLFDTTYTSDNGDTVKSSSADNNVNVIAPGTSKTSTFAFGYTNNTAESITAPEVKYNFKVDVTTTGTTTKLDANPSFKWTLQKGTDTAIKYQKLDELVAAIKYLSGDASGTMTYKPGELPAAFTSADETYTIGWEWAFETAGEKMAEQDKTDTDMGNAANLDNVALTITITATQID